MDKREEVGRHRFHSDLSLDRDRDRDRDQYEPDVLQQAEYQGRKLFIYSAHDTTVAPILHTLGVFNGLAPPYARYIMHYSTVVQ